MDEQADVETLDLPPRFLETRTLVRAAIVRTEASGGGPAETLLAVLMSETLPRLMDAHGPQRVAVLLADLVHRIGAGSAPGCSKQ